jgi:predicted ATPase
MIQEIHIQGYKTLQDCKLQLGKLNVLIGATMSGKSNFINAIALVNHLFENPTLSPETETALVQSLSERSSTIRLTFSGIHERSQFHFTWSFHSHYNTLPSKRPLSFEGQYWLEGSARSLNVETARQFCPLILCYTDIHTDSNAPIRQPQKAAPYQYLKPDGSNLANILLHYFNDDGFRNDVKKIMRQLNPDFSNLFVQQVVGNFINITLKERHLSRDLYASDLSDGTLRWLCLCAILLPNSLVPPPTLICIDEPELGLYPRTTLQLLSELIKNKSEESQLVITTHSPEFLNYFCLDDVVVVSRENGKTAFSRLSSHTELQEMISRYEFSMSDLWLTGKFESTLSNATPVSDS